MNTHQVIHVSLDVKTEMAKKKFEISAEKKRHITWDEFFIKHFELPFKVEQSGRGNKITYDKS